MVRIQPRRRANFGLWIAEGRGGIGGRLVKRLLLALALLVFGQPALAWTQLPDESNGVCGFWDLFDGPGETMIMIRQDQSDFDQDIMTIAIANDNWSIAEDDQIDDTIKFETKGYAFWGHPHAVPNGLFLYAKSDVLMAFARSDPRSVIVSKNDQVIDRLNFSGFYGAFLVFDLCVAKKRRAKAERERMESIERDIPKDPFAGD